MTVSDPDKTALPVNDASASPLPLRALLALEVEHLLPGLDIAETKLRQGDTQGAMRTYATLVLCDPGEPRFQAGLAACALELGIHAVALRAASALIAVEPAGARGYHLSAHAYAGLADYDSAADDFAEARRLADRAGEPAIARDCTRMLAQIAAMKHSATDARRPQNDTPSTSRKPFAASA